MHATALITVVTLGFITIMIFDTTEARFPCRPCLNELECKQPPVDFCPWGEVENYCGRRVCAKGPGERCGGKFGIMGKCGEGLTCNEEERCHGCSLTMYECM